MTQWGGLSHPSGEETWEIVGTSRESRDVMPISSSVESARSILDEDLQEPESEGDISDSEDHSHLFDTSFDTCLDQFGLTDLKGPGSDGVAQEEEAQPQPQPSGFRKLAHGAVSSTFDILRKGASGLVGLSERGVDGVLTISARTVSIVTLEEGQMCPTQERAIEVISKARDAVGTTCEYVRTSADDALVAAKESSASLLGISTQYPKSNHVPET